MEAIFYLTGLLMVVLVVVALDSQINPRKFKKILRGYATHKHIAIGSVLLLFTFSGVLAATEPESIKQAHLDAKQASQLEEQKKAESEAQPMTEEEEQNTSADGNSTNGVSGSPTGQGDASGSSNDQNTASGQPQGNNPKSQGRNGTEDSLKELCKNRPVPKEIRERCRERD